MCFLPARGITEEHDVMLALRQQPRALMRTFLQRADIKGCNNGENCMCVFECVCVCLCVRL